jgi:hypothetical protein
MALLACWRGVVSAAECCGTVLARSQWSGACREGEGEERGVRAVSSISSHVARLGSGQRELGSTVEVSTSMATGSRRTATVMLTVNSIFSIFACQVFGQMPARNSNSNFLKRPLWVFIILDKGSRDIFVTKKG